MDEITLKALAAIVWDFFDRLCNQGYPRGCNYWQV